MSDDQYDDVSFDLMEGVNKEATIAELVLVHRDACVERGRIQGRAAGIREAKTQEVLAFVAGIVVGVCLRTAWGWF